MIGRKGVTAQSIRMLLRALGTKQDARYNLKIVNSDEDAPREHKAEVEEKPVAEVEETLEVAEEPAEVEPVEEEAETSELAEKTRAELADLDDLDI